MEIIQMPGYLEHEKDEIAKRHIIQKLLKEHGLSDKEVMIQDKAISKIINAYTREAGVRNMEREIASLFRKITKEIVLKRINSNGKKPGKPSGDKSSRSIMISPDDLEKGHKFLDTKIRFCYKMTDQSVRRKDAQGDLQTFAG